MLEEPFLTVQEKVPASMAVLIVTSTQQDEHRIRMEKSDVTILVPQINHSWHSIFINSDREKSRAAKT